jgi:hypothetical protein
MSGLKPGHISKYRAMEKLKPRAIQKLSELLGSTNEKIALGAAQTVITYTVTPPKPEGQASLNIGDSHLRALTLKAEERLRLISSANFAGPVLELEAIHVPDDEDEGI